MPKEIKTREIVKGTIKTIDKAAIASQRMKNALVRTKEAGEQSLYAEESTPEEYGADKITEGTEKAVHETAQKGKDSVRSTKKTANKIKDKLKKDKAIKNTEEPINRPIAQNHTGSTLRRDTANTVNKAASNTAKDTVKTADKTIKAAKDTTKKTVKTAERTAKSTIKTTEKTAKTTIKTTEKTAKATIKTAEKTTKATIKTAQATAKTAQKTAQAATKAAKVAAKAAQAAAKATAAAAKATAKVTAAIVKAVIAAIKGIIAAIAAGGWVAALVIVIILLIALVLGTFFGIFFSGEDTGTGQTMQTAIQEINREYLDEIDKIKRNTVYDVLETSGSRALWNEALSVYAVKITTDEDDPQEVVSMDDNKKAILRNIFWQVNHIRAYTELKEDVIETENGSQTEMRTYLYIIVEHKTVDEMALMFGFNTNQRKQLTELLSEKNRGLWSTVLYGITTGDGMIVEIALSQVGNVGGEPYWSWYGFDTHVEWCACFVSWCANECGYIEAGIMPKFSACVNGVEWFKERGLWQDNTYEPRPGDIIFFDWQGNDGLSDHVGIVTMCEDGVIYTVEGDRRDACREDTYVVGDAGILGFGVVDT